MCFWCMCNRLTCALEDAEVSALASSQPPVACAPGCGAATALKHKRECDSAQVGHMHCSTRAVCRCTDRWCIGCSSLLECCSAPRGVCWWIGYIGCRSLAIAACATGVSQGCVLRQGSNPGPQGPLLGVNTLPEPGQQGMWPFVYCCSWRACSLCKSAGQRTALQRQWSACVACLMATNSHVGHGAAQDYIHAVCRDI
jgi:hypothetical protein